MPDYGIIGNGRTAALISKSGSIDWCCLPDFDSPSVFGRLLDENHGGCFIIELSEPYQATQTYIKNTNILETTIQTDQFSFKIIDFMPRHQSLIEGTDYESVPIVRILEPLKGTVVINIRFDPRFHYGQNNAHLFIEDGLLIAESPNKRLYLQSTLSVESILVQEPIHLSARQYLILGEDKSLITQLSLAEWAEQAFEITKDYWQNWVKQCHLPECYQESVIRSALTLKLLVYEKTGAIIASPTTSLPEEVVGERNWDYRYCWIRDALFVVSVLFELSLFEEKERYIRFLETISLRANSYIKPLFSIHGESVPKETQLHHWEGFKQSKPIRIGNNATNHQQHDVYGEVMIALHAYFSDHRFVNGNSETAWQITTKLAKMASERFKEKDSGPWEFNNRLDHYTFSKAMCWVALSRASHIAEQLRQEAEAKQWRQIANKMQAEILKKAWNDDLKAFTQAYGSEHLDASILLLPIIGFISAKDDRMLSTTKALEKKLGKNGFIFRYQHEDDLGTPKNAFLSCTFWLIDNWILSGQIDKARQHFEQVLKYGNHLGLFSEHIEPNTGQLTGNFPQGYIHVEIIYTAMMLSYASTLKDGFGYFHKIY